MLDKMIFEKIKNNKLLTALLIVLVLICLATSYYGSIDIGDYADTAKYFSGDYSADIRNSHSYMFGFLHSILLNIYPSFVWFKITSIIFLLGIIYSVYFISGKDRRTLLLAVLSPAVWYMAPWINPIQMASLFFLWAWFFINNYEKSERKRDLLISGILVGLGLCFWNTILFFGAILFLVFMINKKLSHSLIVLCGILIGLIPLLSLDYYLFGFPFYSLLKTTMSNFIATLFGGITNGESTGSSKIIRILLILVAIPLIYWKNYKWYYLRNNLKNIIFITLCLLVIFVNPQLRYILALAPIMIILTGTYKDDRLFKIALIFSAIVSLIFIIPYFVQIGSGYSEFYGKEITGVLENYKGSGIVDKNVALELEKSLKIITERYPNESFVVGNADDDYQTLAHFYWGAGVKEFVSIQDYFLYLDNDTELFKKEFSPVPNIKERRQIWIAGGIRKNSVDDTDYSKVVYGIGIGSPVNISGFEVIEEHKPLYLSKRR